LGLFIGALGRERTFILAQNTVRLPTDLAGVTIVQFVKRPNRSIASVLEPKCHLLKDAISSQGFRGTMAGNTSQQRLLEEVKSVVKDGRDAIEDVLRLGLRTRYAGGFPECFEMMAHLLKEAKHTIRIICDFPCYGFFSSRDVFEKYEQILRTKIREGVDVTFLFPTAAKRRELQVIQFGDSAADWKRLTADPEFLRCLKEVEDLDAIQIDSIKKLHDYFLRIQKSRFLSVPEFSKRTTEISSIPAIYAWVVDRKALFTIPKFGLNAAEQGFYTSENDVVDVLESVWEYYKNTGPKALRRR
jgi:hypothetical protein